MHLAERTAARRASAAAAATAPAAEGCGEGGALAAKLQEATSAGERHGIEWGPSPLNQGCEPKGAPVGGSA